MTPTQLSLRHLRADGYLAAVVERWDAFSNKRHDLFNCWDIIALRGPETVVVQTTTDDNVAARVRKIADSETIGAVREAGWRCLVHGWRKDEAKRRWVLREVDVS